MELLLEQISQITHGVVLNRIKPKVQSEGIEYPILSISQLLDEENGITDYEVPSVFVDKKKVDNLNLAKEHSIVIGLTSFHRAAVLEKQHEGIVNPQVYRNIVSREGNMDLMITVEMRSLEDLKTYLESPEHAELQERYKDLVELQISFDHN